MKNYIALFLTLIPGCLFAETLTLNQCLESARKHNLELQNAALEIQSASEQQKQTRTKYYPDIQANVMAFQAFDDMMKGDGTYPQELAALGDQFAAMVGQPYSYSEFNRAYSATLTLTQPIYTGGQLKAANKLTAIQSDCCKLQLALKEKDILQKVTENYWQIAMVKYNLSTIEAAEKQIDAVMEQVQNYVKAGVTTRNDILKVKLRQQELASNKLKLQNAEHVLRLLLAQQIGMAGQEIDIDASALSEVDPQSVYTNSTDAVGNREELALAQRGIEASEEQIKLERGKYLPTIAVGVMGYHTGYGGLSDNAKNYINSHMTDGLVFGTVSVPIMSWWGGSHAIKQKKIKLEEAKNTAENARQQLAIDVESSWSNLTEAYKQISIAQASVEEATENLRMSSDQYKMGTETLTDLLDAETLNRQAQNQLNEAKAAFQIRLADYERKTH